MNILLGEGGASPAGWHSIESIFRCGKEFQLREVRKIHKPYEYNPDHFTVGSCFHAGRARWFSLNFDAGSEAMVAVRAAVIEEAQKLELPSRATAIASALDYLTQYIAHYQMQPAPRPLAAEYLLGPAPFKPDDPFYMFRTARLDDVSR